MIKEFLNNPHFIFGKVMHARLSPKINKFTYGIYYISIPLSKRAALPLPYNKPGLWSFHDHDHGPKTKGENLEHWAKNILKTYGMDKADGEIVLICMPRIFGYVFNPVSFWLCYDRQEKLRAVICEVNNTFGQTHSYLCAHPDQEEISGTTTLRGEKLFHVSPFMPRDGYYTFRFDLDNTTFGAWINYLNDTDEKRLITSLTGTHEKITTKTKLKAFLGHPLITFKTIALIHWQALKIILKGIKYIPKPKQIEPKRSATKDLKHKD